MIILYVLDNCPYCNNALQVLSDNKIKFKKIVVENTPLEKKKYKLQNKMNTFPQIFIQIDKNNFIQVGGNDDLVTLINQCKLIKASKIPMDPICYMYNLLF